MKVMLISDGDPRKRFNGGVGVYTYYLAKYLDDNGIKVLFVGKNMPGKIHFRFRHLKFIQLNDRPGQSNYRFLKNLYNQMIPVGKDVVIHAHRPDWLVPFLKYPNKKIFTLHGCHRKNVALKKGKLSQIAYNHLEKKAFEGADIIHSVAYDSVSYYRQFYSSKILNKVQVVPVGTNLELYSGLDKTASRKKYGFSPKEKVVVFIGRFEKEKRHELLIEACAKVGATYWMIGSGREELHLKQYAKKVGCKLKIHEPVANSQVPEMFAAADVFGLTSLYEGFPMNIVEALAAGIPSVATAVGDVPQVIKNGKTGYIVDEDDVFEKLDIAIKNSSKFRKNCLKEAKQYDWKVIGKRMVELYEG